MTQSLLDVAPDAGSEVECGGSGGGTERIPRGSRGSIPEEGFGAGLKGIIVPFTSEMVYGNPIAHTTVTSSNNEGLAR